MNKTIQSALIGTITGFANGLFGSGGGTILVPALQRFFNIETHKSHAGALTIILPLAVLSAWIYVRGTVVNWHAVFWITAGGIPGGYAGAMLMDKLSSKWLHRIFGGFMIGAAIRMLIG